MLKTGQVVQVPNDDAMWMLQEMGRKRLGGMLGIPAGATLVILCALGAAEGIAEGDYMAVIPGATTFYLLPKVTAERWAPTTAMEFTTQRIMEAYSAVTQALGFASIDEVNPDDVVSRVTGLMQTQVALSDVHPADCQSCSENAEPCSTHAQDWRYWRARALDAYGGTSVDEERLDADIPRRFK